MTIVQSIRLVSKAPVGDWTCGNLNLKINRSVKTPLQRVYKSCTLNVIDSRQKLNEREKHVQNKTQIS